MSKKIVLMVGLWLLILQSGCTAMNAKFDCSLKPGVSCASLDQVNDKVDRGEIGASSNELTDNLSAPNSPSRPVNWVEPTSLMHVGEPKPLRYGETVQRIWIAPFEDTSGNYHQASDVYTITKPGHWMAYPVKAIDEDEE